MYLNRLSYLPLQKFFAIVILVAIAEGSSLGSSCRSNGECSVSNARCYRGICECQPYYAQVDNSTCLESTLLGSECVVSEQCTLKVAYSACLDGVCRCSDGHLQFRKHTCLSPAPPGHVCYSNEHCRLWDKESHCEFVIHNLFGRCACNTFFKQSGDNCIAQKQSSYATEPVVLEQEVATADSSKEPLLQKELPTKFPKIPVSKYSKPNLLEDKEVQPSNLPLFTSKNDVLSTQEDSPLMQAVLKAPTVEPSKRLPISNRKDGDPNELIRVDEMTANLHANDQPVYRVVTLPTVEKKSNKKSSSKDQNISKSNKSGHQKKSSMKDKNRVRADVSSHEGPASLGMPCAADGQCRALDPHSRCVNKRCDCAYRNNSTSACSARNRGCLPGTFQCRSTGTCISWYFVCDGRKDCPDGSDEKCQGTGKAHRRALPDARVPLRRRRRAVRVARRALRRHAAVPRRGGRAELPRHQEEGLPAPHVPLRLRGVSARVRVLQRDRVVPGRVRRAAARVHGARPVARGGVLPAALRQRALPQHGRGVLGARRLRRPQRRDRVRRVPVSSSTAATVKCKIYHTVTNNAASGSHHSSTSDK